MTLIKLQDSITKKLKNLSTDKPLKIYLCGPTVYDDIHIGNIAPVLTFDFLIRLLKELKIPYTYVHNITDIDDKIVNKAKSLQVDESVISSKYEKKYLEILKTINIIQPSIIPRVSDHIDEIQRVITELLNKGYAEYKEEDIVFKIDNIKEYGEVSKQKLEELKSQSNFCLWKRMHEGKTWDSPWGKGRPGWHTECFAFIDKYLGGSVDIHGGGVDLKFPHHENENAHCRALHNCPLSNIWIHIGHLTTQEGKISKSGNNKYLVKDLLKDYYPNLLRLLFLTNNYSSPSLVTNEKLDNLDKEWTSYQLTINKSISAIYLSTKELITPKEQSPSKEILLSLSNNLNLPEILTFLQITKKNLLTSIKQNKLEQIKSLFLQLRTDLEWLGFTIDNFHTTTNLKKLDNWREAISNKDWSKADSIREELTKEGLI